MKKIHVEPIFRFMKENNLTKTQFCKLCGFSLATLHKILYEENDNISYWTFRNLLMATNIPSDEIMYGQKIDRSNKVK